MEKLSFKRFLAVAFTMLFASSMFVSCSNDDDENITPEEETTEGPIVLSYDTFYDEDDVIIASADTTTISVSRDYLNTMDYKFNLKGDTVPVTIWRTVDTAPFIRNVIATKEQGDRLILTTVSGDLGDVLGDCDMELDTEIFVDFSQSRLMSRGGTMTDNYNRYVDTDGIIHPAVIILEEEGDEGMVDAASRSSRSGKVYYTAEDIAKSNADFRIINVNTTLKDFSKDFKDGDSKLTLYIKDTNVKAVAGLRINISTKWFSLKKFECAAYGDFGLGFTSGIEASHTFEAEKEETIAKFNCFTAVFWVGPVPIAITSDAGILFKANAELTASCHFEARTEFNAGYDTGVYYSGSWYARNTAKADAKAYFTVVEPLAVEAKASAGLEVFANLKLYGCAGPGITFGPTVKTDLNANIDALAHKLHYDTSGTLEVGGTLSAEIKIWKWKLASWSKDYKVYEKELWNVDNDIKL